MRTRKGKFYMMRLGGNRDKVITTGDSFATVLIIWCCLVLDVIRENNLSVRCHLGYFISGLV